MNQSPTPNSLLPASSPADARTGVLPAQQIQALIRAKDIQAIEDIAADQVQPASLDLRLGKTAYRVRASFLPGPNGNVMDKLRQLDAYEIDLSQGAVLEKGCVYVIPLQESLDLKADITATANPKSSTGRLDIFTRLITDKASAFDRIERGYKGPLYLEVAPQTFSVIARPGVKLNQIRFKRGNPLPVSQTELREKFANKELIEGGSQQADFRGGRIDFSIDLIGAQRNGLIGYRARKHADRIDLEKIGHYDPLDFWEPIHGRPNHPLVLDPADFYILVTQETVKIPPDYAAEMLPYDTSVGEFRVHYAGFFDPGFGWGESPAKAVLEVRSHDVPFLLEHGQVVGRLQYEYMASRPDRLYGQGGISNYQGQDLALGKQFRRT